MNPVLSPQGKRLRQLTTAVTQALSACAESVDENAALDAEFEFSLFGPPPDADASLVERARSHGDNPAVEPSEF